MQQEIDDCSICSLSKVIIWYQRTLKIDLCAFRSLITGLFYSIAWKRAAQIFTFYVAWKKFWEKNPSYGLESCMVFQSHSFTLFLTILVNEKSSKKATNKNKSPQLQPRSSEKVFADKVSRTVVSSGLIRLKGTHKETLFWHKTIRHYSQWIISTKVLKER